MLGGGLTAAVVDSATKRPEGAALNSIHQNNLESGRRATNKEGKLHRY